MPRRRPPARARARGAAPAARVRARRRPAVVAGSPAGPRARSSSRARPPPRAAPAGARVRAVGGRGAVPPPAVADGWRGDRAANRIDLDAALALSAPVLGDPEVGRAVLADREQPGRELAVRIVAREVLVRALERVLRDVV